MVVEVASLKLDVSLTLNGAVGTGADASRFNAKFIVSVASGGILVFCSCNGAVAPVMLPLESAVNATSSCP